MNDFRCKEYANLKLLNTLGVSSTARYLCPAFSEQDVASICEFAHTKNLPLIPLGEGSNIVFREEIEAVVMPVMLQHRALVSGPEGQVFVTVGAGCSWHALVRWTLQQQLHGLENLSLIPGNAGSAPVQNIGAYGVELKDSLVKVRGYHRRDQRYVSLSKQECLFGYRDSIFKQALCNEFIITEVVLCLKRTLTPRLTYGKLREYVHRSCQGNTPTGLEISDAVCRIRQEKLPDPKVLGNAGSFFKNPVVSSEVFNTLRLDHPNIVAYRQSDNSWKLAAGWLIDACGLKGFRDGVGGMYDKQALVLVHYGGGSGDDVLALASMVQHNIYQRFNIRLEIEPVIYPDRFS